MCIFDNVKQFSKINPQFDTSATILWVSWRKPQLSSDAGTYLICWLSFLNFVSQTYYFRGVDPRPSNGVDPRFEHSLVRTDAGLPAARSAVKRSKETAAFWPCGTFAWSHWSDADRRVCVAGFAFGSQWLGPVVAAQCCLGYIALG